MKYWKDNTEEYAKSHCHDIMKSCNVNSELFADLGVKRGLRDKNGNGVLAGLTNISTIISKKTVGDIVQPCEGELYYRGYNILDLTRGLLADGRLGYEEIAHLLIAGELPTEKQLVDFKHAMSGAMHLPNDFVRAVIMKAPSHDMMNTISRSILTLASYDDHVSDLSIENVIRQCLCMISTFPMLAVYGYHAYNHKCGSSFYIHNPKPKLSLAENIMRMLRPDKKYSKLEAQVLDLALVLHMEHGGGNNSTFTTRVVTSSGSDTYSVMAAALSSLKGPKHGGANIKVTEMMDDLKKHVKDKKDKKEVVNYLKKLLHKEVFDKKGLIYGMGHAVYSMSDPRAVMLKGFVEELAKEKGRMEDYKLYSMVENLAPEVIAQERRMFKGVSANVDFYSGLIYNMLGIPNELYTPIFAIARIVGWSAHRIEELTNADKIIRPAYMGIKDIRPYLPMNKR